MRTLFVLFAGLIAFSGQAHGKQVEILCSTKAYTCTGMSGCGWIPTGNAVPFMLPMFKDPGYPNKDAPYELYRATHQTNYDRHLLTLVMEVRSLDPFQPVHVKATLDGGNVFAEATSKEQLDIGIRNHNFGRGFSCTSIRALD